MTSDDRELLDDLRNLNQAIGPFADGIFVNTLSDVEQLDFGWKLIKLAERIRVRVEQTPLITRPQPVDGGDI